MTDILALAREAVGQRAGPYGSPNDNFTRAASFWSTILGTTVSPAQVAMCLAALKMARLCHTPDHLDSWVDIAGYAQCGADAEGL